MFTLRNCKTQGGLLNFLCSIFTINLRQWYDQQAYLCLGIKHAYNLNRAGSLPSISHHRLNMTLITTVVNLSHHQILIGNLVCSKLFTGLTFASPSWKKKLCFYLQHPLQCHLKTVSGQQVRTPSSSFPLGLPREQVTSGKDAQLRVLMLLWSDTQMAGQGCQSKVSVGISRMTPQEVRTLKMYDEYHWIRQMGWFVLFLK